MKFGIIGGGSWGTALAVLWARRGHNVDLWVRNPEHAEAMTQTGINKKYLPGTTLPETIRVSCDLKKTVADNDLLFMAVPLQAYRQLLGEIGTFGLGKRDLILLSKGIELDTHLLPTQIIKDVLGSSWSNRTFTLSGPSFAEEVAKDLPTTVVLAGRKKERLVALQKGLNTNTFRMYRNRDVTGVELCGALKNVIAIASGMANGLGLGQNTLAGLITRGLSEIARLGVNLGARRETFAGLAGMGDLILTCHSQLSRNFRVGMALAQGHSLNEILTNLGMVAEGVHTCRAAVQLGSERNVELPITNVVHQILYDNLSPRKALNSLMSRSLKSELDKDPR